MESKQTNPQTDPQTDQPEAAKPGFFKRLFEKLDTSMKEKADKQAEQGCCCNSGDSAEGKGNKCC